MNPSVSTGSAVDPNEILSATHRVFAMAATILSGENLTKGAVLGLVALGSASAVADGGNTGDGTISAVTVGASAIPGDYVVEIVEASADAGRFSVIDPNGDRLDDGDVASAYSNGHLGFTIADGAADFEVGDKFTITVAAGSGKYKLATAAAADGSAAPIAILAEDCDASGGDKSAVIYLAGDFDERKLTFGSGLTAAGSRVDMAARGLFIHPSVAA